MWRCSIFCFPFLFPCCWAQQSTWSTEPWKPNLKKYGTAREATDDDNIIRRMRFQWWMPKATHTRTRTHTRARAHPHTYPHTPTHTHTHTPTYTHPPTHTHTKPPTHKNPDTPTHTHTHTYSHTHSHTHTPTHTHTATHPHTTRVEARTDQRAPFRHCYLIRELAILTCLRA